MEKQLREKMIHAAILCNPHNPCGRVWEKAEIYWHYGECGIEEECNFSIEELVDDDNAEVE